MNNYPKELQEILDTLSFTSDQNERITLLIDYAEKFKEVPPEVAERPFNKDHRVEYCESEAYVWAKRNHNGTYKLYFAVENPHGVSAKALAYILDQSLSGNTAKEILTVDTDVVLKIFGQSLSMGKNLGLTGIVLMVKKLVQKIEEKTQPI